MSGLGNLLSKGFKKLRVKHKRRKSSKQSKLEGNGLDRKQIGVDTKTQRKPSLEDAEGGVASPPEILFADEVHMTPSELHRFRVAAVNDPNALLPPQRQEHCGRLCVVLDMDETLLHSEFVMGGEFRQAEDREHNCEREHDFEVALEGEHSGETALVFLRPFVRSFLVNLAKFAEVVVFTAALPVYARPLLDKLDPLGSIHYRLYRDATTTFKDQPFVKDVALLGRDMARTVIIDNNPYAMLATPDNAIPIINYYDDPLDTELQKALRILHDLSRMQDIRPHLVKQFEFRKQLKGILEDM